MYYLAFPKDRMIVKIAVGWVNLVGVTQTTLALIDLYRSLMTSNTKCDLGAYGSRNSADLRQYIGPFYLTHGGPRNAPLVVTEQISHFYLSIIGSSTAGESTYFFCNSEALI
jgi:hypothetical protein